MDSFWRPWRSMCDNNRLPSVIDGVCKKTDIANRYAEVFKDVSIPKSKDEHELLRSMLHEGFGDYDNSNVSSGFINVDLVQ